jgi:predicted MFS family arabinose efflux permease
MVVPFCAAALVLAFFAIPSNPNPKQLVKKEPYWKGFSQVLTSRSAVACLAFVSLLSAFYVAGIYGTSFYREIFGISTEFASGIVFGAAAIGILASLISGRLVNRCGRKPLAVATGLVAGASAMVAYYMPELWLAVAFRYSSICFWAMSITASASLMLEQVPRFRGSMMSLRSVFIAIGAIVGVMVGGAVLDASNYPTVGLILGALGILGSLVLLFFAKDPCKAAQAATLPAQQ